MIKFLLYRLFYWIYIVYKKLRSKNFHIVKFNLRAGEIDYNDYILYSCFTIFCEFYDKEMHKIDWSNFESKSARINMDDLYRWWKHERPNSYQLVENNILALQKEKNDNNFLKMSMVANELSSLKEIDRQHFMKLINLYDFFVKL